MFNSEFLRRLAFPATPVSASLLVAAGASGPGVRPDFGHSADFGKYWWSGLVSRTPASPIGRPRCRSFALPTIQSAAAREMESRRDRTSPASDLLVDFSGEIEERTDIESTPAPMYDPGRGFRRLVRRGVARQLSEPLTCLLAVFRPSQRSSQQ